MQIVNATGNYQDWNVYKKSLIICDITDYFCKTFLNARQDRTVDQMRQAARSGKQNIVEGACAAAISRETEIKLTGVAKASLQELLEDYRDWLRQHNCPIWEKDDPRTLQTRNFCRNHSNSEDFMAKIHDRSPETICNIMIVQIHQLDYMLYCVLQRAEQHFLEEGGIKEKMSVARHAWRKTNLGY
jgi:four helix bundle suffix protein